jgi:hypothetical protein
MAFFHKTSKATSVPELEVFDVRPTQTAVEHMYKLDHRATSTVSEGSVVEFVTGGENQDYLCFGKSRLIVKVCLKHQDGTKLHVQEIVASTGLPKAGSAVDEKAAPVNMILHAMFNQIDIFINGERMNQSTNMYPYKAFIKTMLYYGEDAKKTQLKAQGYMTENSDNLDDFTNDNISYFWRQQLFKGSKTVDFEGPLMEDVMQMDKYLLNGMRVQIKLYPALKKFYIMGSDVSKDYKLEIVDVFFRACMVKVNPGVILGHAAALSEGRNAVYDYTRVETKSYSVSKDTSNVYLDNMFQGNRPSKVVFGFVASAAYNGDFTRNPFKFHHYNVTDVKVVVDGQTVPGRPLKIDFNSAAGRSFIGAYVNMYESLGMTGKDYGGGITPELFAKGHTLFVYNLEPMPPNEQYANLKRRSNVRVELNFKEALPETITIVVYAEHTSYFEVDAARNVIMPTDN